MTEQDALVIALASRKEIHAMGYSNTDDARERAAGVLAVALTKRMAHTCETCGANRDGSCEVWAANCLMIRFCGAWVARLEVA